MKLVMWRGADPNFGDELNNWIWPKVIPGVLDDSPTDFFVGIGTLLNHRLPAQHRVVFGSGAGYGDRPNLGKGRWSFYCVRGPLTAQALGLPSSLGVADPGILVRTLFDFESDGRARPVGFMPHKDSAGSGRWHDICDAADILYIDPRANVDDVLRLISGCRLLIAEAMHGAIVADALRVPWLAARIMPSLLNFKWHDWCQSMALDYQPIQIPGSTTEEAFLIRYGRNSIADCPNDPATEGWVYKKCGATSQRGAPKGDKVVHGTRCRHDGPGARSARFGRLRELRDEGRSAA